MIADLHGVTVTRLGVESDSDDLEVLVYALHMRVNYTSDIADYSIIPLLLPRHLIAFYC